MKKVILQLVIVFFASSVWAQLPDFDFSDYTAPEYTTQGLTLYVSPLLSVTSQQEEYNGTEYEYTSINSAIASTYFLELNRERWWGRISTMVATDYSYQNDNNYKDTYLGYETQFSAMAKYYFSGKFYASGLSALYYSERNLKEDESMDSHDFDFTAGGGVGYGRIENINYIRRALHIIDELYENGNLTAYPGKKDLLAFGKLLCEIDNERVYDSRLKRIEDFKRIDSFLKEIAVLKDDGIEYFTILNDMLIYANIFDRRQGTELNISYRGEYSHRLYSYGYDTREMRSKYIEARYRYERALNRYWQLSANLAYERGIRNYASPEDMDLTLDRGSVMTQISWFPNSRTSTHGQLLAMYAKGEQREFGITEVEENIWELQASLATDYYISPKMSLSGMVAYRWAKNHDDFDDHDAKRDQLSLLLTLSYDIF